MAGEEIWIFYFLFLFFFVFALACSTSATLFKGVFEKKGIEEIEKIRKTR